MKEQIIKSIPVKYNPYLHLSIPTLFGVIITIISLLLISNLTWWQVITVPIFLFMLFGFEWVVHKHILHHPRFLLKSLYQKHELAHHIMYHHNTMAYNSLNELYYILMPFYAIFIVFGLLIPVIVCLGLLISFNIALLLLITSMLFFITYEWLHFMYHMPNNIITNNVFLNKLRNLHTVHHNPFNMKYYNFNVTFPIFDILLKTYKK